MSDFPVIEGILISVACAFIFALIVDRFHVFDVVGWPASYFTAVHKAVGGMTMQEPITLCRYKEQDEKDGNIKYATADEFLRIEGTKWICYENGERETQTQPTTTDILRE